MTFFVFIFRMGKPYVFPWNPSVLGEPGKAGGWLSVLRSDFPSHCAHNSCPPGKQLFHYQLARRSPQQSCCWFEGFEVKKPFFPKLLWNQCAEWRQSSANKCHIVLGEQSISPETVMFYYFKCAGISSISFTSCPLKDNLWLARTHLIWWPFLWSVCTSVLFRSRLPARIAKDLSPCAPEENLLLCNAECSHPHIALNKLFPKTEITPGQCLFPLTDYFGFILLTRSLRWNRPVRTWLEKNHKSLKLSWTPVKKQSSALSCSSTCSKIFAQVFSEHAKDERLFRWDVELKYNITNSFIP